MKQKLFLFVFCGLLLFPFSSKAHSSCGDAGWGFLLLGAPTTAAITLTTIIGNSITLANKKNRYGMGIASLVLNTIGMAVNLPILGGCPDMASLFSSVFGLYFSLISYSVLTVLFDSNSSTYATGVTGIVLGSLSILALPITMVLAFVGPGSSAISLIFSSLFVSIGAALGIAVLSLGIATLLRNKRVHQVSILPWIQPGRAGGVQGGLSFSGQF